MGNAAGAAKATARRLEKRLVRRRAVEESKLDAKRAEASMSDDLSMPVLPSGGSVLKQLAEANLAEILAKRTRASVAVRGNLAIRVLELEVSKAKAGARSQEEAAAALAVLAMLRSRADRAVDASILPARAGAGGEAVVPAALGHPPQQSDRQSDSLPSPGPSEPSAAT